MSRTICTIIAGNYLGSARVLMQSVRLYEPQARRVVLFIDQPPESLDPDLFEALTLSDLGIEDIRHWCFKYQIVELATAVKPRLLQVLFRHAGTERVVYLDPDIRLFHSLEPVWQALEEAPIVLTPHFLRDYPPDGLWPDLQLCLLNGVYNLGFCGTRRGPETDDLLRWWHEKLKTHCILDPWKGYFVDQRFMDFAPAFFPVKILKDPGCNAAHWNLHERKIRHLEGDWQVSGLPLYFFHFSGYSLKNPGQLHSQQAVLNNVRKQDLVGDDLRALCQLYATELEQAQFTLYRSRPYGHAKFASGREITDDLRKFFRENPGWQVPDSDPFSSKKLEQQGARLALGQSVKSSFHHLRRRLFN